MFVKRMMPHRSSSPGKMIEQTSILDLLLDPIDRLGETIFAVLILLTFTLTFAFFELNADPSLPVSAEMVNELVIGILGATLAWGLIDGVLYALISVFARGENHRLQNGVQKAKTRAEGMAIIADELYYILEPISQFEIRRSLYSEMFDHLREVQLQRVKLTVDDMLGAIGCVLVCFIAVLPSIVPLVLFRNNFDLAIRLSNMISFLVLFFAGYRWGSYSSANPLKTGLLLSGLGAILALIAIPFGG